MVAQRAHALHRREIAGELAGFAKADREQRALSAGTPAAFVPGAVDERLDAATAPDEQSADAFRRIDLVAGDRQEIDAESFDVGGDLADRLRRIGMEWDAVLARDMRALLDRLNGADL